MATDKNLISQMDLDNIRRLAQMVSMLDDELKFVNFEVRAKAVGAATSVLIERAFTNYDD